MSFPPAIIAVPIEIAPAAGLTGKGSFSTKEEQIVS
jgi:hypothetical protein